MFNQRLKSLSLLGINSVKSQECQLGLSSVHIWNKVFPKVESQGGQLRSYSEPANQTEDSSLFRSCLSEDQILLSLHASKLYPTDQVSIKMAMYNSYIGALMGQSGKSVLRYKKVYGVSINTTPKGVFFPGVRQRLVEVKGQAFKVFMTLAEAIVTMKELQEKNHERPAELDASNFEKDRFHLSPFFPQKLVSYFVGENGEKLRQLEKQHNVCIRVGSDQTSLLGCRDKLIHIQGETTDILRTLMAIYGILYGGPTFQRFLDTSLLAHSEAMWYFENNRMMDENKYFSNSLVEVSMPLPFKYKRMLAGKGGQAIKDIYDFSRAQIDFAKVEGDVSEVKMKGNFMEVLRAMTMIAAKLQVQQRNDQLYDNNQG
eukprot:TRINITY_DN14294_c1_g1_i3.p1 TRINITY_DN14294_c1_g1~~TRINITY_DN14294_c1_g1_i3.p1  ORF type:complete len:409 (+),score=41.60 TRINITY_DN14294_c1_g1_i3:114-1229(+)